MNVVHERRSGEERADFPFDSFGRISSVQWSVQAQLIICTGYWDVV